MAVDPNPQGRIERAPLSVISFVVNFIIILANSTTLHIFRTKYKSHSNYRLFVLFLAALDIVTASGHLFKEVSRIRRVYLIGNNHACPITNYICYSVGFASLVTVLFVAVERYKKICTPFRYQITGKQSKLTCLVLILAGGIINIPVLFIYGKRKIEVGSDINATRCAVLNRFDASLLPVIHFGFLNVASLLAVIIIIILQVKIRRSILHHSALIEGVYMLLNYTKKTLTEEDKISDVVKETPQNDVKKLIVSAKQDCTSSQKDRVILHVLRSREDKNNRITLTFCIVTSFLLISFQAFLWFQTILSINRYLHPENRISKSRDIFYEYFPDVITLNSLFNPFVYYLTDDKFRRGLKGLYR